MRDETVFIITEVKPITAEPLERSRPMAELDLDAFPVIRIDQIPLVDSSTLQKACDEVKDMIEETSTR